ncbi:MAG: B12-binding domain-containing radical SAM protein [Desulfobacterales bacterium]|nr:B12-binding domain-containing radical SAM protein [Desulfobacterales bacterium]
MSDILLIQPPIRDFYLTTKRTMPYGLICIASALIKAGFSTDIFDGLATSKFRNIALPPEMAYLEAYYGKPDQSPFGLFHHFRHFGYSFEHMGKVAVKSKAFLIGISSLFTAYSHEALKSAQIVKKYHPNCKVVLGGHHPTNMPENVMECEAVDYVLRGEGEVSMPILAEKIMQGEALESVPGIVFRKKKQKIHINKPAIMENLNHYPLPAMHLIKHSFYQRKKKGSMVILSSRGCPLKCSYCCLGASSSFTYRQRSTESIIQEIEAAVSHYKVGFIDFEDENISLDTQWFLSLLREIKKRFKSEQLEFRAMNGLFPPTLNEEVVQEMKAVGFKVLNLSLGSVSKKQLNKFHRPDVISDFEHALILAERYGLQSIGYVIAGAPDQTAEDSVLDLLYLAQKRVLAGVSIFYPAPGSRYFELSKDLGILPKHLSLMRSSALPVSHTTSRTEAVTLMRLGRILNFIKSLLDQGLEIPAPLPFCEISPKNITNRIDIGIKLLQCFFHDGKIRGMLPNGEIFEHRIAEELTRKFIQGLRVIQIRGTGIRGHSWRY